MIDLLPSGLLVARFPGGLVIFGRTAEELSERVAPWWRRGRA